MENYSEVDIARIINDCEILILPDNSSIEEVLTNENQHLLSSFNSTGDNQFTKVSEAEETEEDFERIYQQSCTHKSYLKPLTPTDFSNLYESGPSTSSSPSKDKKPNPERVLMLNRIVKDRLVQFRSRVLALIEKIDVHYRRNNLFLEQAKSCESKDSSTFKSSYIKCGAPFFKNALGCTAPFNEDYKYRKNVLGEFFPFDMPVTNSRWKTKEKVALIKGVKTQMIRHIKSQQSQKLCQEVRKTRNNLKKMKFISNSKDLEDSSIMEIYESIQKDYSDFTINWNILSFNDLQSAHSVAEAMGMWYSYLKPDLNREPFTEEENKILLQMVGTRQFDSWDEIAAALDRRSSLQAFIHCNSKFLRSCPSNVRWTDEEDKSLGEMIEKYSINGIVHWNKVGQNLPNRNKTQCYNRYQIIYKSAALKKGTFSRQENRAIIDFVEKYGENNFNKMPKHIVPGRSTIQIKNHYNNALRQKGDFLPWTNMEDEQLVEFVKKEGTNKWSKIAEILETHTRISCRTRYLTISKFLAKHPNATVKDVPSKPKKITSVQKASCMNTDNEEESIDDGTINPTHNNNKSVLRRFKENQPDLFSLLKTTFNFDLSNREINADDKKVQILMFLFDAEDKTVTKRRSYAFTTNQLKKLQQIVKQQLDQSLLKEMLYARIHTQFLMPPNYNSVIGLRAVVIKLHEEPNDNDDTLAIIDPSEVYRKALVSFQKLYFSLFYWSAMLSKVDKDELNVIHFTKYPSNSMTSVDIFQSLTKRNLPIQTSFHLKRSADGSKTYPVAKRAKNE